jgi:GTP cyclohydrolase I
VASSKKNSVLDEQIDEPFAGGGIDLAKIEAGVRLILEGIGEDPDRAGLRETPRRVAEMYQEICAGLHRDPREFIHPIPAETHDEMVIVKGIPIYSVCEHHLLPFVGVAHIAYIPKEGRIVGLSKLARVADLMAKKPQIQERLTTEIADLLFEELRATGVMVVIEAEHLCMEMRGIKKPGSKTITSALRGGFLKDQRTRAEAMALIRDHNR